MPTYQYKCTSCDYQFEEFQLITETPLSKCPQCGGEVKRIISGGAGFLFKGSGFYITDYRSESYKSDAKNDKPMPKPAASSSKKSDKQSSSVKTGK